MADAKTPTTRRASAATPKLPDAIFGVEIKTHDLLKLAYDSYLAASRTSSAVTLRRGEVSGGGKKPWKQKGTGRARFGSSRNPIWRGGGVVFGPLGIENYTLRINKRAKRVALRQALTLAQQAGKIIVTDFVATGKTKDTAAFLADNKLSATRRTLIAVDEKTPEAIRGTRNMSGVYLMRAQYLSVYHILNADTIVLTPAGLKVVEAWLSEEATS